MYKNTYKQAISKGEAVDFLMGRGIYLYPDYDWGGIHTPSSSFYEVRAYAKTEGEEKMQKQFEKDIQATLNSELTILEFLYVVTYIRIYYLYTKDEQKLSLHWNMNDQTKILFTQRWEIVQAEYASDAFNLDQIGKSIKQIKERYGVSLLG